MWQHVVEWHVYCVQCRVRLSHGVCRGIRDVSASSADTSRIPLHTRRSDIIVYFNVNLKLLTKLMNGAFGE